MSHAAQDVRAAFHYLLDGEVEFLQDLARQLPPRAKIVNIGAGAGTSCLALLEARDDLNVITVDIQADASPLGGLQSERNALEAAGLWGLGRHIQIHGDSKEVGRTWEGGPVDLVFIDGDHSYEGCSGDVRAWGQHIRTGGFLVFHDYDNAPWGDVKGVVRDLIETDPDWEAVGIVSITAAFKRGAGPAGSGLFL